MTERLPRPAAARITEAGVRERETLILLSGAILVRVHPMEGPHPVAWDQLRRWGPTSSRFDHHTLPRREHPTRRIAYLTRGTTAFTAALGECFQDDGGGVQPIDRRRRRPAVTALETTEDLRLLDLDSGWVTRAGGNQAIRAGPRGRSRERARAIHRALPDIDGLAYGSSVWGPGLCLVLWERAERALPSAPTAHRTLDDPALDTPLAVAAEELGPILVPR